MYFAFKVKQIHTLYTFLYILNILSPKIQIILWKKEQIKSAKTYSMQILTL